MANASSNGTGGGILSATATWAVGTVPASGDVLTVTGTDVVYVDTANTLTLNQTGSGGGTLTLIGCGSIKIGSLTLTTARDLERTASTTYVSKGHQ